MMTSPPRDQVETVLAELIEQSLERGESVHIPGLGTFSVRHESSAIQHLSDGETIVMPPRDEIIFTPSD